MASIWDYLGSGGGFDAASTGTAGLLTPQDKLMALFSGLTNAGVMMAQPGLGKGQALAMGLGGLGHGIQQGNQMALQQRLVEQRLAEQQRKQLAQDRFATMISMGANGPRAAAGGAGGVGSLSAEQRGIMSSLAAVDPSAAATLYGKSMEFNKPKDQLQEINGQLYNVADPRKPVLVANAQRPQQALGQLFEEQKKYTPGSPEYNAYQSAIQQQQIKDGFRVDPSGAMAPARGGPADPTYISTKSGAEAWGRAPATVAINNAQNYTLGDNQVRMPGSPLNMMPGYGLPSNAPPRSPAPQAPSAPTNATPPAAGPQIPGAPPGAIATNPGQRAFTQENSLRDEFTKLTGDFRTVQDAYNKIGEAAKAPTGAGDMSLLYSYVKLLDPGSVVRESEFATAAASGSFGERIQGLVSRIISGERLPDSLRKDFLDQAKGIYGAQKKGYDNVTKQYETLAKNYGVNPANVTTRFDTPEAVQPPAGAAPRVGQTITNPTTGERRQWDGTQWAPIK